MLILENREEIDIQGFPAFFNKNTTEKAIAELFHKDRDLHMMDIWHKVRMCLNETNGMNETN